MQLEAVSPAPVAEPAAKRQSPRFLRLIFSFPVMLSMMLCVLTVLTVRGRFNDPDMWWHLKTGEIIWNTHHVPTVDTFSYTTHNHAYVPHEWLSQLTIYAAYHLGGYSGMMLWLCVLGSLLLIAGYALCSVYSGNAKVAFLGAITIWLFSTIGLSIRPQMIGYLLLVCELLILHFGRTRNVRWFFLLPPLFAVWVNCHGSFLLGFVVAALILACSFVEFRMGLLVSHRWQKEARNFLAFALLLSVAALFVNPIGWQQVTYPLDTIFHQSLQMQVVSEWQPLKIEDARGMALLGMAGLILLLPSLRRAPLYVHELLLLCVGAWFALHHNRMVFVFGIMTAPILCRLLAGAWESYEFHRDRILPNAAMATFCAATLVAAFPSSSSLVSQVQTGNPVKAVEFLRHSGISGNMLNEYVYGGYLIWAAPQRKVFVDGRGDVFEWTGVLQEFGNWTTLEADPRALLDKYRIDVCVLAHDAPMSRVLGLLPGWVTAYADSSSVVFVRSPR